MTAGIRRHAAPVLGIAALLLCALIPPVAAASTAAPATAAASTRQAAAQTLTWTAGDDITRYLSAPTEAAAGETTIVFENSAATGNTTGMPHTLTFDTTTEGYNHDVPVNILANPFDANDGRHEQTVTLTPGRYRYFCTIPGHSSMVGEFVVTDGPGDPDTTPPTVSAQVTGERDAEGSYVGSATVAVTAADAGGSGVAAVEYQVDDTSFVPYTAPVVVSAPGDHAVQFRATDVAGNVSAVGSVSFRVAEPAGGDTTPPAVSAAVTGTRDAAGNYVGSATVTVTATDAESGVATVEYSADGAAFQPYTAPVVVTTPGTHMVHFRATDTAGNVSPEGMAHFTVTAPPVEDTTPPVVSAAVSGDRDATGAYLGGATVTITATDAGSGVATIEYAADTGDWTRYTAPVRLTTPGPHTVRYRATDQAGNTSAEGTATFTVVVTGPDACPGSDERATVVIDGDDTGVPNRDSGNGCTVNDLVAEHASYPNHAAFVRHVESVTAALVASGVLTHRQQGLVVRAAARSGVGA